MMVGSGANLEDKIGILSLPLIDGVVNVTGLGFRGAPLVELSKYGRKADRRILESLQRIRDEGVLVLLNSGMGNESRGIANDIPHDYLIQEYGSLISDRNGVVEGEYWTQLEAQIDAVERYRELLADGGYVPVVEEEKKASFRIIPDTERGLTSFSIADLLQHVPLVGETETVKNVYVSSEAYGRVEYQIPLISGTDIVLHMPRTSENGYFVVLPEGGGYRNAIAFIAKRFEISWDNVAVLGVDDFWSDALSEAGFRYRFSTAVEDWIVELTKGMGSYVTRENYNAGTVDILRHFLRNSLPQMKLE